MPELKKEVPKEMQEQLDIFVSNGMNIVHDPKVSDDLLNKIMQAGDPVRSIAEATVDIVTRLSDSAAEKQIALSNEVMVQGANIVMGEIINVAEAAGMQKMTDEQKTQSFQLATSMYLDSAVKSGKISPEQLAQLGQQAKESNPEAAGPPEQKTGILGGM